MVLRERMNACNNQFLFGYNVPIPDIQLAAVREHLFDRLKPIFRKIDSVYVTNLNVSTRPLPASFRVSWQNTARSLLGTGP